MEYALQETAYFFETAGATVWSGLRRAGQHLLDHVVPHHRNNYHPYILGHRTLALFSILLITVKIAVAASVLFETPQISQASAIKVNNVILLANQSRTENGRKPLTSNPQLAQAAQAKANDMLARQYFAHNTPTGEAPWSFIKTAGYKYLCAGENLAVDFTEAENVEDAWMNSPGHRANILNKCFEEIGIGISEGQFAGHHSILVVQMFGAVAEQPVTVQDAPTPVEQPAVASASTSASTPASTLASAPASAAAKPAAANNSVANAAAGPAPTLKPAAIAQSTSTPVAAAQSEPARVQPIVASSSPTASEASPTELKIINATAKPSGQNVAITVHTSLSASKVLVVFGDAAIMLDPTSDAIASENSAWTGSVPLARVAGSEATLIVRVYDMSGNMQQQQLASFSHSTALNFSGSSGALEKSQVFFNIAGAKSVNFLGANINVQDFQTKFYLIFIAGVLAALILAIGIKRHIQHLSLVANSSFVVVLALFLWMAG